MRTTTQYLLPHKFISFLAHLCADCKIVLIKNFLIRYFINRYPVKMQEAIVEDPFAYPSYNDFFTRQLKPECRPIDTNPKSIVSPADGQIAQFGKIDQQQIIQAKGHSYQVQDLLGGNKTSASLFNNGKFITIYLAPKDYHRVHMPVTGKLMQMVYVPGQLFSVNTHAAENIPNLFARNERVVAIFETSMGKMAVVLVGAMIVGSIETVWAGKISPPHAKKIKTWDYSTYNITLQKGAELGCFKLGSTVIVLFEPDVMQWDDALQLNQEVKFGQQLGYR